MVSVTLGEMPFEIGSPLEEEGRDDNEEPHDVWLTRPEPAEAELPALDVSWLDAAAYCNRLSEAEGLTPCYTIEGEDVQWPEGLDCEGYRLPTEAEWEYAARAGVYTRFVATDDAAEVCAYDNVLDQTGAAEIDSVNYPFGCDDGFVEAAPVASRAPNPWGLYDMGGNAWEWCWDWYSDHYEDYDPIDPVGAESGSKRVVRGSSWLVGPGGSRAAERGSDDPTKGSEVRGFRIARTLE
jgi:sulfatase modifying factor 1